MGIFKKLNLILIVLLQYKLITGELRTFYYLDNEKFDINIEAILINDNNIFLSTVYNNDTSFHRKLAISITWDENYINSNSAKKDDICTLIIKPVNELCGGKISYYRDINCSVKKWIISYDRNDDDSQLKLESLCSYNLLFYWPNSSDVSNILNITYTIPECVNGTKYRPICHCDKSSHSLFEIQDVNSLIETNFTLNWYMIENINISEAYFIVFIDPLQFLTRIPWSNNISIYSTNINIIPKFNLIEYSIIIKLTDENGCSLSANNITFYGQGLINSENALSVQRASTQKHLHYNSKEYIIILLPSSILIILIIVIIFIGCKKFYYNKSSSSGIKCIQTVKSWRTVYYRSTSSRNDYSSCNIASGEESNVLYVEQEIQDAIDRGEVDNYEVNYNRLHIGRQIGQGAFGRVFLARIDSVAGRAISQIIAVKKLRQRASPDELDDFLSEISMLKHVGYHRNIVSLIGCCTLNQPYCMLMEWVPCGDLLRYLRKLRINFEYFMRQCGIHQDKEKEENSNNESTSAYIEILADTNTQSCPLRRSHSENRAVEQENQSNTSLSNLLTNNLDATELHNFAFQIATGMAHLEKKNIIHRDLAARNILVSENKVLKISDFGLSRTGIYVNTRKRKLPLRWLSIEAIKDQIYSSKSDIWAYGVVLWEIGTLGGFPYSNTCDSDLFTYLTQGKRLEKPTNCTDELYKLMLDCWSKEREKRPSFQDICDILNVNLNIRKTTYVDFNIGSICSATTTTTLSNFPPINDDDDNDEDDG